MGSWNISTVDKTWLQTHCEWRVLAENIQKSHDIESMEIMSKAFEKMVPFVKNKNSQQVSVWHLKYQTFVQVKYKGYVRPESTKQMEKTLRAKVKIFSEVEN